MNNIKCTATEHKQACIVLATVLKGKLSDSFTNYNDVGNTKLSVSIKKT